MNSESENSETKNDNIIKEDDIIEEKDDIIKEENKSIVYISPDYNIPLYIPDSIVNKFKDILVFSGGGIKGIALLGILQGLEDLGYLENFNTFAGSSVGALILGLLTIGYKPSELWEFIKKFDLSSIKSINAWNILQKFGLDTGKKLEYVIKRLIEAKGLKYNITLKELYNITKKKLIITTVCLNDRKICYLSYETHPDIPLYLAIRMSTCIPIYFTPIEYKGKLYVDGSCIDGYPIRLFDNRLDKVLGVFLEDTKDITETIDHFETYIFLIIECLMSGVNFNSRKGYEKYTITVKLESINIIDFELDIKRKITIYESGIEALNSYYQK
jgi:NTE family protein